MPLKSRVLVVSCGPGSEALAAARAVGDNGRVRATDKSDAMVAVCRDQAHKAGFVSMVCEQADASDTEGGPWDAILCAFGLWQLEDRPATLAAWAKALAPRGKVAVVTWGPPDPDGPFERLARALAELEPKRAVPPTHVQADRDAMSAMFEEAGLALVRHTVVRHTLTFKTAEHFVRALREACTWRRVWEELGDERLDRVAAKFYAQVGGPDAPLSFSPPATIAVAGHPGAEVELAHRPSVRVPAITLPPGGSSKPPKP